MDKRKWWHHAVIYEIYPRSFKDSNGDGIGDIRGIIDKLDYLKSLGVNAIWLCPVYTSPNIDGGYDVADYYNICNELGTLEDMEDLIEEAHKHEIKIIMELVANHTSDQHYWFRDAIKSKNSKYRDYYIWKKEKEDGSLPNNWMSSKTGKSVWTKIGDIEEYYLHLYTEKQPDLNWENKEVRFEIYNIMKYWFDKGVDGFRMDVINKIAKASGLPDVPDEVPYHYGEMYFENYPHVHNYLNEMYQEVLINYPNNVAIGQTSGVSPEEALLYTDANRNELNLFLQFEHVNIDCGDEGRKLEFSPYEFKKSIFKWQKAMDGRLWNTIFFGSHDLPRMVSHYGNDQEYHEKSAKMLATIQLLLRGTQIIYMGDEIGMTNVNYSNIDDYIDNRSKSIYENRVICRHEDEETVSRDIRALARDNARYPMQWNDKIYAGFSSVNPWMKVNDNYTMINVSHQEAERESILSYYKELIRFRNSELAIAIGTFGTILEEDKDLFAYKRVHENVEITVIANMSINEKKVSTKNFGECVISNYDDGNEKLRSYEVNVYKKIMD